MLDVEKIVSKISKSIWPQSTASTIDYTVEMIEHKSKLGTNILSCIMLACSESHCLPNATTNMGVLKSNYTIGTFQNLCEFNKAPQVWINAIQLYRYGSGNPYADLTKYFSQSLNLIGGDNYDEMLKFNKQLVSLMGKSDEYVKQSFISGCMNNFLPVEHLNVIDKTLFSATFDTRGNLGFNIIGASIGKQDSDFTYLEYFAYMYQLGINWGIFDQDNLNGNLQLLEYDTTFFNVLSQEERNLIAVLYPQVAQLLSKDESLAEIKEDNVVLAIRYLKRIKHLSDDYDFNLISNPPYLANPQFCLLDNKARGGHSLKTIMNTHKSIKNLVSSNKRIRDKNKESIDDNSSFFVKVANYIKDTYEDWTNAGDKSAVNELYQESQSKSDKLIGRRNLGNENGRRRVFTDNDIAIYDKVSNVSELINKLQRKSELHRNSPIIKAKVIL